MGLVFLELTLRSAGWLLPSFLRQAGKGALWVGVGVSPAHQHCSPPLAAKHVWEPALHFHGPYDWLLCLFCHHVPGNQGMELPVVDSGVTGFRFAVTQELGHLGE